MGTHYAVVDRATGGSVGCGERVGAYRRSPCSIRLAVTNLLDMRCPKCRDEHGVDIQALSVLMTARTVGRRRQSFPRVPLFWIPPQATEHYRGQLAPQIVTVREEYWSRLAIVRCISQYTFSKPFPRLVN